LHGLSLADFSTSSKAAFLGDSNCPKSGLTYYKDGRQVLFQELYSKYSYLGFTKDSDRAVGLLGMERRLARTFDTDAAYGVFKIYLHRSLLWQAEFPEKLKPISYPIDRQVPSWSWMAYAGHIKYVDAPFNGVEWSEKAGLDFFRSSSVRQSSPIRNVNPQPRLSAVALPLKLTDCNEWRGRLFFDSVTAIDGDALRCVLLGHEKQGPDEQRTQYVLLIKRSSEESLDAYQRVGIGRLLPSHIASGPSQRVCIQ
jgi:hypothetical protein